MQVCHPDMPTGDAGRFRKITWAAEDLDGNTPVGHYRLFTKWTVSDLSHAQCSSTVSRRTWLMVSLHESFGYTFGKMTSYSMGITWALWVICLAPGWILRLSHGISYRVWPQVLYEFSRPAQRNVQICLRFPIHFCSNPSDHWSILSCYALRRSSTVLALVWFHFTGRPFSRLVGRYPQVHCNTHRGTGSWCRRAMASNRLYHAMLKRCEDWLADPFADEEGEQFDIEEFIAQVSEYVESVESGEEVLKARLVPGPFWWKTFCFVCQLLPILRTRHIEKCGLFGLQGPCTVAT